MSTQSANQQSLLCLKCRQVGHLVKDCTLTQWQPEVHWALSHERSLPPSHFDALDNSGLDDTSLCNRCTVLHIPELLAKQIEWISFSSLNSMVSDGRAPFRVLGKVGSIEYRIDCSLCRCLFALTPNPFSEDQDVVMFPSWSILRLEGSIVMDSEKKRAYSKCLIVTLRPSSPSLQHVQFADTVTRGNALCFLEEDRLANATTLNARCVKRDGIDVDLIQTWLNSCQQRHPFTCTPQRADALQGIKLIDCSNPIEHQLVQYPGWPCDYLALSYVWGHIEKRSFELGPIRSGTLPLTIEDAIVLVRQLGKRYLWCDLVCIDQMDDASKQIQIGKMADIYRGAYATIVAISGRSAETGLPKVGRNNPTASQMRCTINGKRMVSLMPALTQLIWVSPWGQRAWTLQEALLSRRCIYLSDYQMYWECNGMQCSESLDETRSWIHQLSRTEDPEDSKVANVGGGCLRHNLASFDLQGKDKFLKPYVSKLVLYSYRSMTEPRDAINALAGILQDWKEDYGIDFYFGLPIQYFQWGLLWTAQNKLERRPGFPAWSWAGWTGPLWHRLPFDLSNPDPLQPFLTILRTSQNQPDLLFNHTQTHHPQYRTYSPPTIPLR